MTSAGPAAADAAPKANSRARFRNIFTGESYLDIDISDEEGETDVSKGNYFSKGYFIELTLQSSNFRSESRP